MDKLDELVKRYVQKVKDNSAAMLDRLNADLEREAEAVAAMAPVGADIIRPSTEGGENERAADCRPYEIQIIQESDKHRGKAFTVKVVGDSDPSQITLERWERFCFGVMDLEKRMGWGST